MRYLRQQNINRRAPYDQRLYVDMTNSIVMTTTNNLLIPKGTTAQRPVAPLDGMLRYNTDIVSGGELEVYQSGIWRSLRFKEPTEIVQQTLGIGDAEELIFGPLNPEPPIVAESNLVWSDVQKAKQILVFVENVFQISGTNYALKQNPAIVSGDIISFIASTNSIISANTSIINFTDSKFRSGMTITVSGSVANNGTYTIVSVTSNTIVVTESIPADESTGPTITLTGPYTSGYYVAFDTPVPLGKPVTVLHGFDQ